MMPTEKQMNYIHMIGWKNGAPLEKVIPHESKEMKTTTGKLVEVNVTIQHFQAWLKTIDGYQAGKLIGALLGYEKSNDLKEVKQVLVELNHPVQ